jgi:hypothetical protein
MPSVISKTEREKLRERYETVRGSSVATTMFALLDHIDALEGQIKEARWRVNDVREQLLGPFHAMDEFGATNLNLKQVVDILDAAIASASEVNDHGG